MRNGYIAEAAAKMMGSMTDNVNNPSHYAGEIECIDAIRVVTKDMTGFRAHCRGTTIKYLWRGGKKQNELEDLKKARWYLDKEIAELESEND